MLNESQDHEDQLGCNKHQTGHEGTEQNNILRDSANDFENEISNANAEQVSGGGKKQTDEDILTNMHPEENHDNEENERPDGGLRK